MQNNKANPQDGILGLKWGEEKSYSGFLLGLGRVVNSTQSSVTFKS